MKKYVIPTLTMISTILIVGCNSGGSSSASPSSGSNDNIYAVAQDSVDSSVILQQLNPDPQNRTNTNNFKRDFDEILIHDEIKSVKSFNGYPTSTAINAARISAILLAEKSMFAACNTEHGLKAYTQVLKDSSGINSIAVDPDSASGIATFNADANGAKVVSFTQNPDGTFTSKRIIDNGLPPDDYMSVTFISKAGKQDAANHTGRYVTLGKHHICNVSLENSPVCAQAPWPDTASTNNSTNENYYDYASDGATGGLVIANGVPYATKDGGNSFVNISQLSGVVAARAYFVSYLNKYYVETTNKGIYFSSDLDNWTADATAPQHIKYVDEALLGWNDPGIDGEVTVKSYDNLAWNSKFSLPTRRKIKDIAAFSANGSNDNMSYELVGEKGVRFSVIRLTANDFKVTREASGFMPRSGSVFSLNGGSYVFGTGDEGHLYNYDLVSGFSDSKFGFSDLEEIKKVLLYRDLALEQAILMNRNGFAKFDGKSWDEVLLKDLVSADEEEDIQDADMFNGRVYFATSAGRLASIGTDLTASSYRKELNPLKNPIAQIAVTQDGRSIGLLDNTGSFYAGDAPIAARLSLVARGVADVRPMIDGYALRFIDGTVSIYGRGLGSAFTASFKFPVKVAAEVKAGFDAYGDSASVVDASVQVAFWNKFSGYSDEPIKFGTTTAGNLPKGFRFQDVTFEKKRGW